MSWEKFETEEKMKEKAADWYNRIQDLNWVGPGWYWVVTRQQKCPRG